jgi:hypothetical protein
LDLGILLGIIAKRRWFYIAGLVLVLVGVFSPAPVGTALFWIGLVTLVAQVPISVW